MRLNIHIKKKRLKIKDLLAIEDAAEGRRPVHTAVGVIAKCLQDNSGEWLPIEQALPILEDLDLEEMEEVVRDFQAAIEGLQKTAVPPTNGGKQS